MHNDQSVTRVTTKVVFALAAYMTAALAIVSIVGTPAMAEPLGEGNFRGATGHVTSGSVAVKAQSGRYVIELGGNFSQDGAPDPYVALGKGSGLVDGGLIAVLKSNTGKQRYAIKISPALEDATHVLIWCKKFAVPIGVASIE